MKRSVPFASHLWPGVTPCTGIVPTGLALAQAASNAGAKNRVLRILRLLHRGSSHLEPAVLDPEGEPALDQVDRVLAELFVTPAGQDIEVLADAGGKRFEIIGAGDQSRGDPGFLGADLKQQLQQVA